MRDANFSQQPPLVVDLDGTLIRTDMLWESVLLFLKRHFWQAWLLPFWLMLGKAGFKQRLAERVDFDPAALPYDEALLAHLRDQRNAGRRLVLATGSEQRVAHAIAQHLQLFDQVLASGDGVNLTSSNKAQALAGLYGQQGFDYIGNASVDIPVWQASRVAYSVTAKPFRLADDRATAHIGGARGGLPRAFLKALRPRQWMKNFLVFVPMLAGHAFSGATLYQSIIAFVAFSLCASSAYLLNDALDAQDDRRHPTKRLRPIAAGTLPLPLALAACPLLAAAGLALSTQAAPLLTAMVLVYFGATLAYSFQLKRMLMVDIVTLAMLYTLRILGGGAATGIEPSFWLLAFSFFIFLSLALLKRYSELFNLHRAGREATHGRSYTTADKAPVGVMGVASGFMSVLIFMLYFNSSNVLLLYPQAQILLGIVPLLVLWLGRLWILAARGQVNEDPVLYVSKDGPSLLIFALCFALAAVAALR